MSDQQLIDAYIERHGVRHFEPAFTCHTTELLDWLARETGVVVERLSLRANGTKIYLIDGKRKDLKGLIAIVDRERIKRGLQPITLRA